MAPAARGEHEDDPVGSAARNKKRNAALSCAECRRLKLRCDRKFPCSACVKRGCSAICPDGSLTTGKGNRFVLANTEALHEKIAELSHRVRELEDALSSAHGALSNDPHPLLRDDLLRIKNPLEREVAVEPAKEPEDDDTVVAVGSLSISHTGRSNFYGQTANAWYLLQNEEGDTPEEEVGSPDLYTPSDIPWLGRAFPFASNVNATMAAVRSSLVSDTVLPSEADSRQMADWFYENASWMYDPIPRQEFEETILARIYDADLVTDHDPFESHRLAVLYMVLALGTLVNLKQRSHSPQAAQYYQLARAALSLDSVFDVPSIPAIQALLLMCHYLFLADVDGPRWTLMGIVVKLAQSIGLHRDSSRWGLDPEETRKRRALMWEIIVYDSWQSLTYGRPPSFSMAHIDSKMAHPTTTNSTGQVEMSFAAWKHRFCGECLSVIHDQAFGARPPSYSVILEFDKKVRNYYVPPSLQVPGFGGASTYVDVQRPSVRLIMQRHIILAIKEVTLLYMHRGFFARAMDDHPDDPLGSKYGQSVLSAHRSASSFVALIKSLWSQHRQLTERMWFLFTHVFSCTIVLGSIVMRCPSMGLARSALQNLDCAYELFTNVSETSRSAKVLPVLSKLRERAHAAIALAQNTGGESVPRRDTNMDPMAKKEDEAFANLGGKTRLVSPKPNSPTSSTGSRTAASSPEALNPYPSPLSFSEPMRPLIGGAARSPGPLLHSTRQIQQHDLTMYSMVPLPAQQQPWQDPVQDVSYMQLSIPEQQTLGYAMQNPYMAYDYSSPVGSSDYSGAMHGDEAMMPPPVMDPEVWRRWAAQFNA